MGRDKHAGPSKNAIHYKAYRNKYRDQGRKREQYDSSANGCFVMLLVFIALLVVGMIVN